MVNGRLERREEAMDVWPWGASWLQDEACQFKGKGLERLEIFWASKRQAWTPRRSHGGFPKHWGRVAKSAAF